MRQVTLFVCSCRYSMFLNLPALASIIHKQWGCWLKVSFLFSVISLSQKAGAQKTRAVLPVTNYTVIPITQITPLPPAAIPTKGWNGFTTTSTVYPLKISSSEVLYFNNMADRSFVQNAFTNAGITSVTRAITTRKGVPYSTYAGRYFDYYYYCNAINNGYFTVNGLTTKKNTSFSYSYDPGNDLYTIIRKYNANTSSEAISKRLNMAKSMTADLNGFNGTEYLNKRLVNLGSFFFFLSRTKPLAVSGSSILDQCNSNFMIRGVNFGAYWQYDGANPATCLSKIAEIKKTNANAVRLPWSSSTQYGRDYNALDAILSAVIANKMIAVPEFHDITCSALTGATISQASNFWVSPNVLAVLKKHQNKLILNIANEPGNDFNGNNSAIATKMVTAYKPAIAQLRGAGLTCPIMIDAPDCGQNVEAMLIAAPQLLAADPLKNIIFSCHAYWGHDASGSDYKTRLTNAYNTAKAGNICLVVGEFSSAQDCPLTAEDNNFNDVVNVCNTLGIGYFPWEWGGSDEYDNNGNICPADDRGYSRLSMSGPSGLFTNLAGWGKFVADQIAAAAKPACGF